MEEEKKKIDGKMKSVASIPANYVSILQLQERWMREKELNQKKVELVEREVKQQVHGQRKREEEEEEEDVSMKLEAKGLRGGFIRPCGVNRWKKEPKKEEVENGDSTEKKKKKKKKKKKVKEIAKCESPAYFPIEENNNNNNNNPVKEIVAKDSAVEETQFQDLWIKKRVEEVGRQVKGPARHDWSSTCVIRATTTTRTMVWVKKVKNNGSACGNGL